MDARALIAAGVSLATANGAKSGSTVSVTMNSRTLTIEAARDLTIAAGDVLLVIQHRAQWFAVCRLFAAAPATVTDNDEIPDPTPTTVTGSTAFAPIDTGSWRAAGWRSDYSIRQGQQGGSGLYTGAIFYGGAPAALSGATVTAASMLMRRRAGSGSGSTLVQITETERPSGAPTVGSTTAGPAITAAGDYVEVTVPTAWGQALVDGTIGGLGFYDADGSPYVVFDGRDTWPPAGTLTLEWTR